MIIVGPAPITEGDSFQWREVILTKQFDILNMKAYGYDRREKNVFYATFEKKGRSFDRLLLAPIPLELLMLAKTAGAILFGVANAFVPIVLAAFLTDFSKAAWSAAIPAIVLIAVASTFMGLFIAVSVSEIFEAQTFSNFFRFPMIFLCGLFFPIERLPVFLRPLSYVLPLTYGADVLHGAFNADNTMLFAIDFCVLGAFCIFLFAWSLRNIKRRWIL
jgi:ABC-2 type transport system permease protein